MPGVERLQKARQLPVKMSPYRLFVLEFDEYCVRLDTDSNQHWTSVCDPELRLRYARICRVRTTMVEER